MPGRFVAAALLMALALATPSRPALAASATSALIPDPSSSSWQLDEDGTGALTAQDIYGAQAGSVKGFVDAYEKSWTQPGQILADALEHFSSALWAALRLGESARAARRNKAHASYRTVSGFGGGAYEVTNPPDSLGFQQDIFVFTQGDYVAVIIAAAKDAPPDHGVLMNQAGRQLDQIPINEYNSIARVIGTLEKAATLLFVVVAGVAAVVLFFVIRSRPSRKRRASVLSGAQLSPDGRYVWDGTTWSPIPPDDNPGV